MNKYSNPDITQFKNDGFGHARLAYHMPTMRGVRVKFDGKWGTITDAGNGIIVKPDEAKYKSERWHCHPTWKVEYFPTPTQAKECEARRRAFWAIAYPNRPYPEPELAVAS